MLVTAWLVLVLAWGALHGWIVPRIGELRPALEIQASRVLGVPVRIGSITARSEGLVPSFELLDVVLLDPQGRAALRLPRVVAALSPRSLWNLGFDQLYIERPELEIRRAADGHIFVAGLDFSRSSDNAGRAADWFFRQTEFVVKGGTLRWIDEVRGAPPLALSQVDFVMRNGVRSHALRLDATPPLQWGDRFSLRGLLHQPLLSVHHGRWREWKGQLHGDFARVDVSQLQHYANFGIDVSQGHGAVRAWADVDHARLTGGVADVVLADVNTQLRPDLTPLALQTVSGRLGGKRLDGGFQFQTHELQFLTREGERWPGGNLFVSWTEGTDRRPARGEIRADRLDLFALAQLASHLPLDAATHSALVAYAPKGLVETVQASWQGPLDAPQKYQAHGRAVGLDIAAQPASGSSAANPHPGRPGIRGATVDFDIRQAGGKGRLQLENGAVEVPGVLEDPLIPFDQLSAELQWQIAGNYISATVSSLKFNNADAQGEGRIGWHTGSPDARWPGVLDLQASLSRANGTRVHRYLPLDVPKEARDYVRASVLQGRVTGAKFRVKGDLRDFPFSNPRLGEFRVTADVRDVTYAVVPAHKGDAPGAGWPALTGLSGQLIFERSGMQVKNAAGHFAGAPGLQVRTEARIPDLDATVVAVTGEVRGPLAQALGIVNGSALSPLIDRALATSSASGNADVRLKLELPVAALSKSRVQGSIVLAGNDIQLTPDSPVLARARGTVAFSERGFSLSGAQARALGGDVRLEGGSRGMPGVAVPAGSDATIFLRAQGTASAEGLRQARELGFLSRLARDTSGSAAYNLTVAFRRGVPEVAVTSDLQGLALNLPPPLNKAAETALPLRYENALTRAALAAEASGPVRLQDQLTVQLGRIASGIFVRDVTDAEPRVLRGAIGVGLAPGESAALPEQGVMGNINLAAVNVDAWSAVLDRAAGTAGDARADARAAPAAASTGYLPTVLAVRAKALTLEGRTLHNVVVGGSRDGPLWHASIDADELNGYVEYQSSANSAGRVHARLARLSIAAAAANEVESLLAQQPERLPALDIVVDDFELRGKKLGRLEIDAVNRGARAVAREGGVREWRLNKLNLSMPEAVFSATGNWVALNAQTPQAAPKPGLRPAAQRRRTAMKFRLEIADSGLLLARLGMKDVVRRGKGRMEGQVAWLGSPFSLNYPSLDGSFYVSLEGGQFLKADPGLAKLLGVLSLQSLPRRLALDFRDVFSEGFGFDFLRGDVTIENGIAATNNLQMKGVNAAVLMEGRADIARETQDLKVVVVPEINAGTASLVATVINPAIGLGSFLAQIFLRKPLMRAATQEFHIDGTWADPRVTRIGRKPADEGRADVAPEASPGTGSVR
jgi:uncharacterized protein (TIGR02099 family)